MKLEELRAEWEQEQAARLARDARFARETPPTPPVTTHLRPERKALGPAPEMTHDGKVARICGNCREFKTNVSLFQNIYMCETCLEELDWRGV